MLVLPPGAFCAEYDTSGVPEYTVSLAKRMGLHADILVKAERQHISTAAFTEFYTRVAAKNIQLRNLQYYVVLNDVKKSPVNVYEYYRLRTESEPANADYWAFRGMAEEAFLPGYAAIKSYSKAIELDPNGGNYGYLYYLRGRLYAFLGEPARAISDLTASLAEVAGNPLAHLERARAYFDLADYGHSARDLSAYFGYETDQSSLRRESVGFLCEALRRNGQAVHGCGDIATVRASYAKKAAAEIQTAAASVRGSPVERALALSASADTVRLMAARKILQEAKPSAPVLFLRGYVTQLLARQRVYEFSDALADFEAAALTAGKPALKAWALERQADICGQYGDLAKSETLLGQAVALLPGEPRFYLARAAVRTAGLALPQAQSDMSEFFARAGRELAAAGAQSSVCRQFSENGLEMQGCRPVADFIGKPAAADPKPEPPLAEILR